MMNKMKIVVMLVFGLLVSACGNNANDVKDNGMGVFLPVEKAFAFSVKPVEDNVISARWEIADGYYLYKDKFEFAVINDEYQIAELDMPKGKMIDDKVFGNKESYDGSLEIRVSLKAVNASGKLLFRVGYQGCSEKGLCYPPQSVETEIAL